MSTASGTLRTSSSVSKIGLERYLPGTIVSVGAHRVEVINYLAEGGFAQIYVVKFLEYLNEFENKSKVPLKVGEIACLKRVLVQDENGLSEMRNEVEVMKSLRGARNIVQYYDSNASRRHNGTPGFEVLLLMELCPNKSLLDYMNQRLATKLTEKEILKIMYDVSVAVSQMHYLKVPLIHRDIKIENVLVDSNNNFKLCDFGSTSQCFPVVTTHQDIAILTQNIYVHTTPQYRSPEMIDLYRCLPINEKSDIWALGIFLYKLLFFITPFEMTGQFAILHSKYEFPRNNFPSKLINLIIIMLAENPYLRPNIYQVVHYICDIMGLEVPIEDKYGKGAYNFDKYSKFQASLQNVQYQMYVLQQKKLEGNGVLDSEEEELLNDLFISSFEVSSKIPLDMEIQHKESKEYKNKPAPAKETPVDTMERTPDKNYVFDRSNPPSRSLSENDKKSIKKGEPQEEEAPARKTNSTTSITADKPATAEEADPVRLEIEEGIDVDDLDTRQMQKSLSPLSSDGKSLGSSLHGQNLEYSQKMEAITKLDTSGTAKQHKSNNPFPKIGMGYSESTASSNFFLNDSLDAGQHVLPENPPDEMLYRTSSNTSRYQIPQQQSFQPQARHGQQPSGQQQISQVQPQPKHQPQQQHQQQPQQQPQQGKVQVQSEQESKSQQQQQQAQFQQQQAQIPQNIPQNQNISQNAARNYHVNVYYNAAEDMSRKPQSYNNALNVVNPVPQNPIYNFPNVVAAPNVSYFPTQLEKQQPINMDHRPPPQVKMHNQKLSTDSDVIIVPEKSHGNSEPAAPISQPDLPKIDDPEKPLIEFSPPRDQRNQKIGMPSLSQKSPKKHESLDLTYNEMNFSQDDIIKDAAPRNVLYNDDFNGSASSESISINLEEAKKVRNLRDIRNDKSSFGRRSVSRLNRPSEREKDQAHLEVREENPEAKPGRKSLDLEYQEIRFSSNDFSNEDLNRKPSRKTSGHSKHRKSTDKKHRNLTSSGSDVSEISEISERNSGVTLKHSDKPKSNAQVKQDLERYKRSNKKGSNSSVNISSMSSNSSRRKSFQRAPASLDLDRSHLETINYSDASKRRSFFSVFRSSDKK